MGELQRVVFISMNYSMGQNMFHGKRVKTREEVKWVGNGMEKGILTKVFTFWVYIFDS